jgi:NAD(P)-dependent dehydrogenase (short-subunit alcohol dehydrogenase family)
MSQGISNARTVLVTDATDGIGYATARRFIDEGATVYLHARDQNSGEKAMTRLVKDGAEPLRLYLVVADFTHLDEVADLADTLATTLPAPDVLANNAAVAAPGLNRSRGMLCSAGTRVLCKCGMISPG